MNQLEEYVVNKSKIANKILNYFISKGVKTNFQMFLGEDNSAEELTTQINLYVDGINDFAFFYDFTKNRICYASIFEFLQPTNLDNYEYLKEEFSHEKGIFDDLIATTQDLESGIINEVHAYNEFKIDEFSDDKLDEIYDFLMNKNEFFINLAAVSEKFNYIKADNNTKETEGEDK